MNISIRWSGKKKHRNGAIGDGRRRVMRNKQSRRQRQMTEILRISSAVTRQTLEFTQQAEFVHYRYVHHKQTSLQSWNLTEYPEKCFFGDIN